MFLEEIETPANQNFTSAALPWWGDSLSTMSKVFILRLSLLLSLFGVASAAKILNSRKKREFFAPQFFAARIKKFMGSDLRSGKLLLEKRRRKIYSWCLISSSWDIGGFSGYVVVCMGASYLWGSGFILRCNPSYWESLIGGELFSIVEAFLLPTQQPQVQIPAKRRFFSPHCLVCGQYWNQTHLVLSIRFHKCS